MTEQSGIVFGTTSHRIDDDHNKNNDTPSANRHFQSHSVNGLANCRRSSANRLPAGPLY
jgi:hypothetical protein